MNFSPHNLCSIESVLADVLLQVDDEAMRKLSPGFYKRQVKNAINELAFDTYYSVVYTDLDMPSTLNFEIPKNMWNIKDIFVWNSQAVDCSQPNCDDCSVTGMQRVFYKRNFISKGKGYGYTARNHEGNFRDPFIHSPSFVSVLWYNTANGIVMLSDGCKTYDRIRIVANGLMGGDLMTQKIIPPFVREAVTLWVTEHACMALRARDPKYRVIYNDTHMALYGIEQRGRKGNGIWDDAVYRLRRKDNKETDDFKEYLAQLNY